MPRSTGTPCWRKRALPWYSWIFMEPGTVGVEGRPSIGGTPLRAAVEGHAAHHMSQVVVPLSNPEPRFLIERSRQARSAGADLVELRLDLCLQEGGDPAAIIAAIPSLALPAIVTLRHARENGAWDGDETDRLHLYAQAGHGEADPQPP